MLDLSRRCLLHALILSLAIHALILFGVVSEYSVRPAAPASTVQVVIKATEKAVVPTPPVSMPPAASPAGSPHVVVSRKPPRRLFVEKSPLAEGAPPSSAALPAEPPVALSASADRRPSGVDKVPASPADAPSADDLRQYRMALAIAARRFKSYPALARTRGWQGTAEVALIVGAHRGLPEVILVRSSGYPVLDHQAQEMMLQAALGTVLPESLAGRDLRILLPVQFSLDADQ